MVEVLGSTRYRIDGDLEAGQARIHVIDQRGIATTLALTGAAALALHAFSAT